MKVTCAECEDKQGDDDKQRKKQDPETRVLQQVLKFSWEGSNRAEYIANAGFLDVGLGFGRPATPTTARLSPAGLRSWCGSPTPSVLSLTTFFSLVAQSKVPVPVDPFLATFATPAAPLLTPTTGNLWLCLTPSLLLWGALLGLTPSLRCWSGLLLTPTGLLLWGGLLLSPAWK